MVTIIALQSRVCQFLIRLCYRVACNVQFCCECYHLYLCDMLCPFLFDNVLSVSRPVDDMSLSYADVIRQLAMIRDGVLTFTDSHFSTADTCSFIYFLYTV